MQCLYSKYSACPANTVPVQQMQRLCSKYTACAANTVPEQLLNLFRQQHEALGPKILIGVTLLSLLLSLLVLLVLLLPVLLVLWLLLFGYFQTVDYFNPLSSKHTEQLRVSNKLL
jgi:hypothetical protein